MNIFFHLKPLLAGPGVQRRRLVLRGVWTRDWIDWQLYKAKLFSFLKFNRFLCLALIMRERVILHRCLRACCKTQFQSRTIYWLWMTLPAFLNSEQRDRRPTYLLTVAVLMLLVPRTSSQRFCVTGKASKVHRALIAKSHLALASARPTPWRCNLLNLLDISQRGEGCVSSWTNLWLPALHPCCGQDWTNARSNFFTKTWNLLFVAISLFFCV